MQRNSKCCCCFRSLVQCLISVVVIFLLFVFGVRSRRICLCLTAWRFSGFGGVRKQFSGVASFCQQQRSVKLVHHFLLITPKWMKTGMNVFFRGKILDWFKNIWTRILCMWFWFFLVVGGDRKAPFSIASTQRSRGGRHSFPWIPPLYPCYIPYIAEC